MRLPRLLSAFLLLGFLAPAVHAQVPAPVPASPYAVVVPGSLPDPSVAMAVLAVGWAILTPALTEAARALSAR